MDDYKQLIHKSNDLLNEAMHYASDYHTCEDNTLKDIWYKLANMHIDGYNATRMAIASYVSKHDRECPEYVTIWSFIKTMQDDYIAEIKKLM